MLGTAGRHNRLVMRRPLRLVGVLVVAGVVASGASAMEETINPGVGIGKLKLGMTRAQVVRTLGRDYVVNESSPSAPTAKTFFVVSVAVRTRYEALPEFARDFPYRCRDGWQSTALPRSR
jgi:hypothetical protein